MKALKAVAAAGGLLAAFVAQAELPPTYFAIDAFAVSHDERIPDGEVGLGGRIGIGGRFARSTSSSTGIELGVFSNPIKTSGSSRDQQTGLMIDVVQTYVLGGFEPYLFAGLGGVDESIGLVKDAFVAFEVGGGLLFSMTDSLTLRTGLSAMSVHNDELESGTDAYLDYRFNVGLLFGMAGAPAKAPAPAPAPRVTDSDGDGLADSQDKCPTTPASTADGCPPAPVARTDADSDGVYDSDDACPGTLEGLKVDERGCAVQTEEQSVVLKGVTFLPGSATLTGDAKSVLETAAAALTGQKDLKVEIGGHTDAQGGDAANQKLSQRRADSVRTYLMGKGVEGERLTAKGYGEAQPIADNNTPAGRAENRRVEFKIVK